ncbi:MAG: hypothetical protein HEEMFOPI_01405 [Holosporales bacterium]
MKQKISNSLKSGIQVSCGKMFGCFLFCCFISPSWASQNDDLRDVGEFTGGEYCYPDHAHSMVPTASEGFMTANAMEYSALGAPLSEDNGWPEKIDNQGIFPYLVQGRSDPFCAFVQDTYKYSCAVIEYTDDDVPLVIGSGGYLYGELFGIDEGVVATARHNFQGKNITRLYVRFYNYEVNKDQKQGFLHVKESYIDVPVVRTVEATNGLDAGVLCLKKIPPNLCSSYTRMISPATAGYADGFACMPEGKYALFHFAGGHHLVSVGHIYAPPMGTWISSNIRIEGGNGASGAMFLQKNIGLEAHGISIYRYVEDCSEKRRAIPFSRFFASARTITDSITAPYAHDPNFVVPVAPTLASDGYEFLRWRDCTHIGRRHGGAFNHPADPMYDLENSDNMSNHHIIPIDHLIWLFEYFCDERLDEATADDIKKSVNKDEIRQQFNAQNADDARLAFQDKAYKRDAEQKIEKLHTQAVTASRKKALNDRYAHVQKLIDGLTPGGVRDKTQFAWAWWNLFKGPNCRADDPAHDGTGDYSEKHAPLSFEQGKAALWLAVKGLDNSIKSLKKASQLNDYARISKVEKEVEDSFNKLANVWKNQDPHPQIHPYNSNEWIKLGKTPGGQYTDKDGHKKRREKKDLYILKLRNS